ncbi:hypothetical protein Tco_0816032 [Tanacetum coccineum]
MLLTSRPSTSSLPSEHFAHIVKTWQNSLCWISDIASLPFLEKALMVALVLELSDVFIVCHESDYGAICGYDLVSKMESGTSTHHSYISLHKTVRQSAGDEFGFVIRQNVVNPTVGRTQGGWIGSGGVVEPGGGGREEGRGKGGGVEDGRGVFATKERDERRGEEAGASRTCTVRQSSGVRSESRDVWAGDSSGDGIGRGLGLAKGLGTDSMNAGNRDFIPCYDARRRSCVAQISGRVCLRCLLLASTCQLRSLGSVLSVLKVFAASQQRRDWLSFDDRTRNASDSELRVTLTSLFWSDLETSLFDFVP